MADPSQGLTYDEVDRLKQALGDTASPLSYAVARLLISSNGSWVNTKKAGALVLVIDRIRECKILRLYDLKSWKVLFDEELYVGMQYQVPVPYFHQFEIQGAVVGFDFVNEKHADAFWAKVQQFIPKTSDTPSTIPVQMPSNTDTLTRTKRGISFGGLKSMLGMEDEVNMKMSVVSKPTNVKHMQHIGYDPEKGFQVENIPSEWKAFFKSAGIKAKDLKDAETAKQIMSTIDAFAAANPDAMEGLSAAAPPPVAPPAPASSRTAPPPPAKGKAGPPAPAAPAAPPAPPAPAAPPAPPAPAAPAAPAAPKAPGPSAGAPKAVAPSAPGRGDLNAQIQQGLKLKSVTPNAERPSASAAPSGGGDLADQLRSMMAARRQVVADVHSPTSGEEEDDW